MARLRLNEYYSLPPSLNGTAAPLTSLDETPPSPDDSYSSPPPLDETPLSPEESYSSPPPLDETPPSPDESNSSPPPLYETPPSPDDKTPPPLDDNSLSPPPSNLPKMPKIRPPPPAPPSRFSSPRPSNHTTTLLVCTFVIIGAAAGVFIFVYKRRQRRHAMAATSAMQLQGKIEEVPLQSAAPNVDFMMPGPGDPPPPTPFFTKPPQQFSTGGGGLTNPIPLPSPVVHDSFSKPNHPEPNVSIKKKFTYNELAEATDNFSESYFLGEGGFGYVHKGVLAGGKLVAIKRLKDGNEKVELEFKREIEIISGIHHKHLVSMVGYCISKAMRFLVYEFVPNNTLKFHLHGKGRPPLSWAYRMKIAIGTAKGLAYLHEECQPSIIHRDIKAANILLDDHFGAKVADFGLAKLLSDTDTHVSTRVMGSFGYLAPEYAHTGQVTHKSDVFSYGVVLLELITGRQPIDHWANNPLLKRALEYNNYNNLVDPKLQDYNSAEMDRMVACAYACVHIEAQSRPLMSQIVRDLEGNPPGHSRVPSYNTSRNFDNVQHHEGSHIRRETTWGSNPSEGAREYGVVQVQPPGSTNNPSESTREYGVVQVQPLGSTNNPSESTREYGVVQVQPPGSTNNPSQSTREYGVVQVQPPGSIKPSESTREYGVVQPSDSTSLCKRNIQYQILSNEDKQTLLQKIHEMDNSKAKHNPGSARA